ncbi:terminase small subunit [Mucilaginibacter xinganensis]|uniref:Uncharacterized protein n=1 Tax=Mucilaginibacter xinganensis TaxID=1234841 RepID=A0A223NTE5_9SPHI|nr:terminase small subunit [Mucilaginibacter xinganensis]ASU33152.1 hypothetical protein MuYL_1254 [Mucilaginibacter xinganensis]
MLFQPYFTDEAALLSKVDAYFNFIEGEYHLECKPGKEKEHKELHSPSIKVWDRDPEPATFAGLALFLGFSSINALDDYTDTGEYPEALKWGRLRVEASYEKKLHAQSATGAIFALKAMGWSDRGEGKSGAQGPKTIKVEVLESGPEPAESEKEVVL